MKLLIISDLHANAEGVRAILAQEKDVDAIYGAGDYVDYGPDPCGSIAWVREYGVRAVHGNHDHRLIRTWNENRFRGLPKDEKWWVHYNCELLSQEEVDWLTALPTHLCFEADGIAYLMQHQYGERYEIIESQFHFDEYWDRHYTLPMKPGQPRRMIFGHSHRQAMTVFPDGSLWLNPGSASYRRPDEPSKDAFYAVIEDGEISFRHVPYDRAWLFAETVRLRPTMKEEEYHVAEFFFGWQESDGPDYPWLAFIKDHFKH